MHTPHVNMNAKIRTRLWQLMHIKKQMRIAQDRLREPGLLARERQHRELQAQRWAARYRAARREYRRLAKGQPE